jgi:hypothetical protein
MDLLKGRVDIADTFGIVPGPPRRGTVKYKSSTGAEDSVTGLIGTTEDEGRLALGVQGDDGQVYVVNLAALVAITWNDD